MREWMISLRELMGLTLHQMSKRCGVSETLLDYLEMRDSKTLPSLARQIGKGYGMTLEQANELAKPLQEKYVMIGGKGGGGYTWYPPKEETVGLIARAAKKALGEPPAEYKAAVDLVKATGKSTRQLSEEAGRGGNYLSNLLSDMARGRVLAPNTRKGLARILGCEEDALKGCEGHDGAYLPAMS